MVLHYLLPSLKILITLFHSAVEIHDFHILTSFIIWQAPHAGSMQRILCSDWLPEWARWSDTAHPGLPVSFPQIKFCQSPSGLHESFLSLKLFSAKVKRFFVISLSLWNQKTGKAKVSTKMKTKLLMSLKNTFKFATKTGKHKSKNTK